MTQIDGGLRSLFRERLRQGFHWQSIETGLTGLGVPDANFCCSGAEGWIEFKQTDAWAVTLRPEQAGWIYTRWRAGGRVLVAVRRQHSGGPRKGDPVDELWLWSGQWARELKRDGMLQPSSPHIAPIAVWSGGPGGWDWGDVRARVLGEEWCENRDSPATRGR